MKEQPINQSIPVTVDTEVYLHPKPGILSVATKGLSWIYLACIVAVWVLVRYQIDKWWPATLIGYSPRYLVAAPLILLFPMCLWKFRKGIILLFAAGIIIAWPIMGLQVPLQGAPPVSSESLRILTANMGGGGSFPELLALVERESPDIVVLQEFPTQRKHEEFLQQGWHTSQYGHLFCASRFPILRNESVHLNPNASWEVRVARFEIAGPAGSIELFDIHLPTVREGLQDVIDDKFDGLPELEANCKSRMLESQAVSQWVRAFASPRIMLGDFNMPEDSAIYQECWSQYQNAFSARGVGYGFTKFTRYHGIRIDHILTDRSWEAVACRVGPDIGGDHRPVIAELVQQ